MQALKEYTKVVFTKLEKSFGFGKTEDGTAVFFPPATKPRLLGVGTAYACYIVKGHKGLRVDECLMTWETYLNSEQPITLPYYVADGNCFVCKQKFSKKGVITEINVAFPPLPEVTIKTSFGAYIDTVKVLVVDGVEYKGKISMYHFCPSNAAASAAELEAKMQQYGGVKYAGHLYVKDEAKMQQYLVSDRMMTQVIGSFDSDDNGTVIMDALDCLPASHRKERVRTYNFDGETVTRIG